MTEANETFRGLLARYRAEDRAERERGRAEWAERTREERAIAATDRAGAARGAASAADDMLAYGLGNFAGIAVGALAIAGGLWLAISAAGGG